ncbi:uncharacterized protein LOC115070051 [Nannospalax galili]|uniref:uncharacterized protein LOC115070051 n=1 Tax=Nannospalax galili TaxID=1026970 RepID=UPI00111C229F|nr:uncharacterized protein LOC115070051 [Nannospalax galili]
MEPRAQEAFDRLKEALLQAPALSLPDPEKPFALFIDERKGVAKGVLAQQLGPWKRPVAYLSKRLDPVASGWPSCLRILAAIALLVKEADKLTFGQDLKGLLLDSSRITFSAPVTLNPATLLPDPDLSALAHDCRDVLSEVCQTRIDLRDTRVPNMHVHGAIYRERGFQSAEGKELKNLQEVQRLLRAIEKPRAVAVIHVPGHQVKKTPEAIGNNLADTEAKRVALSSPGDPVVLAALEVPIPELPTLPPKPDYSPQDLEWIKKRAPEGRTGEGGWSRDQEGRLILPEILGKYMLTNLHRSTHLGWKKLLTLFQNAQLVFPHQTKAARLITGSCNSCAKLRPAPKELHPTGSRERGRAPGRYWEIDFTEVKPG